MSYVWNCVYLIKCSRRVTPVRSFTLKPILVYSYCKNSEKISKSAQLIERKTQKSKQQLLVSTPNESWSYTEIQVLRIKLYENSKLFENAWGMRQSYSRHREKCCIKGPSVGLFESRLKSGNIYQRISEIECL